MVSKIRIAGDVGQLSLAIETVPSKRPSSLAKRATNSRPKRSVLDLDDAVTAGQRVKLASAFCALASLDHSSDATPLPGRGGHLGRDRENGWFTVSRVRRRLWLARIAGLGEKAELTCRDAETLQWPAQLALLPRRESNRDLYLDCRSTLSSRPQRLEPLLNRIVKGMMVA